MYDFTIRVKTFFFFFEYFINNIKIINLYYYLFEDLFRVKR